MAVDTFMIMTRTAAEGPNIDDTLALCEEVERLKKELAAPKPEGEEKSSE